MENTNIVTTEQQAPNTISASNAIFNVQALGQLTAFANLMADSQVTVPAHLAGKPADCMAIVMQAMQWGMNPYACWSLSAGANPNFIATQMGHTDAQ
ncbi:recombinase RecT, partial [Salmonella enterica subsp. enterica]